MLPTRFQYPTASPAACEMSRSGKSAHAVAGIDRLAFPESIRHVRHRRIGGTSGASAVRAAFSTTRFPRVG